MNTTQRASRISNVYNTIAALPPASKYTYTVPEGRNMRTVQQNMHHALRRRGVEVRTTLVGNVIHVTRL